MQKRETLAQLICRTVLEFEQRQAALEQQLDANNCSNSTIATQVSKKSKPTNRKKKTA